MVRFASVVWKGGVPAPGGELCGLCQGIQISQYIGCSKPFEHAKTFEAMI